MTSRDRGWRPGAFVLGLAVGGLVAAMALGLAWPFPPFGQWSVSVTVNGQDVDRHGGARLVFSDGLSRINQRCVDGCDDVQFHQSTREGDYEVKVLDARGICIACDNAGYVTNGLGARLVVAGEKVLHVEGGMAGSAPAGPATGRELPIR